MKQNYIFKLNLQINISKNTTKGNHQYLNFEFKYRHLQPGNSYS
jgi:hypothetical protein